MQTLVIYDIVSDRIRKKVMEACKDYGLAHIQYSAFFGDLNHNLREELVARLTRTLGRHEGKIMICPVCDKDLRLKREIEVFGATDRMSDEAVVDYHLAKARRAGGKKAKAG